MYDVKLNNKTPPLPLKKKQKKKLCGSLHSTYQNADIVRVFCFKMKAIVTNYRYVCLFVNLLVPFFLSSFGQFNES